MPAVLSKNFASSVLGAEWSFGYNCYEVGHTWTPSCTAAALEVSLAAASNVLPLYTLLYLGSQLALQQKCDLAATSETIKSICRSSLFIFFHTYTGAVFGCALRNSMGRFYYRVLAFVPGLLSSYVSLLIEKPARRQALAFYVLNLASEIVFRMALAKGIVRPVAHGETLVFALSLAAWYHLIKQHGFGHDPVSWMVKLLVGRHEAKSRAKPTTYASRYDCQQVAALKQEDTNDDHHHQHSWLTKHHTCPHNEATCLHYVLQPLVTRFLIGYAIQSALRLSVNMGSFLQDPWAQLVPIISLRSRDSRSFGLFLATLVAATRLTSCLLRRYSNSNELAWHGALSGLVAGLSMAWAPKSSLSMYVMWKVLEQYYLLAYAQGKVSHFNWTILTIYALSASTILYTFALEPKLMRPSYMKFLDKLSDHRLHQLNRLVLDVFGTGASIGYEDYFPDLDPNYMSNQFKELIFNWMIQPPH